MVSQDVSPTDPIVLRVGLNGAGGLDEVGRAPSRWTHYRMEDEGIGSLMKDRRLAPHIAEALTMESARPRVVLIEDGLLVVLRGINCNPGADPEDMVSMRAWVDADRIVTVSPRRVFAIEDVHAALQNGQGPKSPIETLVMIASQLVERMRPVIDGTEDTVDRLTADLLADGPQGLQRPLSDLRHMIAQMRRHMAPQRDALRQMLRMETPLFQRTVLAEVGLISDRQSRYVEDLDSVRERATVLQDEMATTVASQMNNNMYLLSVVAAVFLPLGLLTGLLGINVAGMPGAEAPLAFWIVCALLVVIAIGEIWYFKKRGIM